MWNLLFILQIIFFKNNIERAKHESTHATTISSPCALLAQTLNTFCFFPGKSRRDDLWVHSALTNFLILTFLGLSLEGRVSGQLTLNKGKNPVVWKSWHLTHKHKQGQGSSHRTAGEL